MKYNNKYPFISIVVIGMNEEENLDDCFRAIEKVDYSKEKLETIYVDTGSTDNSVIIAKKYTDKVFVEESEWPTPGLARNRGLIESKYEIVHFIDGDIQIDKDYLRKAVEKLKESNIHAVYGFKEEKSKSGINKILMGNQHTKKLGLSHATAGGGTYRKEALLKVNGYDERIKKGQETELGERFRQSGYNIWLLDVKQGTHNYGVRDIYDLFKRDYIAGMALSYNMLIGGQSEYFKDVNKRAWRSIIFNLSLIFILVFSIIFRVPLAFVMFILLHLIYLYVKFRFFLKIKDKETYYELYLLYITRPIFFYGQIKLFLKYIFLSKPQKKVFIKEKMDINKMMK